MAYKEVQRVDISEVIRRWQAGGSRRRIASGTGLSRETVGKYIALAEGLGVSREGPTPTEEQLRRLAAISRPGPQHGAVPTEDRLAPWDDQIYQWLTGGRLQLTRVQELLAQQGCPVSYASLHWFVARRNWRGRSRSGLPSVHYMPSNDSSPLPNRSALHKLNPSPLSKSTTPEPTISRNRPSPLRSRPISLANLCNESPRLRANFPRRFNRLYLERPHRTPISQRAHPPNLPVLRHPHPGVPKSARLRPQDRPTRPRSLKCLHLLGVP